MHSRTTKLKSAVRKIAALKISHNTCLHRDYNKYWLLRRTSPDSEHVNLLSRHSTTCLCVHKYGRVCMRACVCAISLCVFVCLNERVCVCVCTCSRACVCYPSNKRHEISNHKRMDRFQKALGNGERCGCGWRNPIRSVQNSVICPFVGSKTKTIYHTD